jgi:CRISPR-associated protein Cas2
LYVILIYDVAVERVSKVLKKSREYLTWIQNSVFEGEITEANLLLLKRELEDIIDKNYDSIIIFILRTKYDEKIILGRIKNEPTSMF